MTKILEMIGLVLLSIMILGFGGAFVPHIELDYHLSFGDVQGNSNHNNIRKRKRKQAGLE